MILTYAYVLVVLVVPGLLVARLLHFHLDRLLTWAAIPAFSVAVVFLLAELMMLVGAPFNVFTFAILLIALAAAVVGDALRHPRPSQTEQSESVTVAAKTRSSDRANYAFLAISIAVGLLTWWQGLQGASPVPPGADGENEGFLVARIVHAQSIAPSKVFVSGSNGGEQVFKFFPVGQHASAAISSMIGDASIGRVLVAMTVIFSAVVLPLGMFVLARFLFPRRTFLAGFTVLALPFFALFPYSAFSGGDVEIIAAMALVPITVVLAGRAVFSEGHERLRIQQLLGADVLAAALALVAVVSVHTTEIVVVAFLVLLLAAERLRRRPEVLRASGRAATMSVMAMLLYAPTLATLVGGTPERATVAPFRSTSSWHSFIVPDLLLQTNSYANLTAIGGTLRGVGPDHRQVALAVLAVVGAAVTLWWRKPAWAVGWVTMFVLALFASTSDNWLVAHLTIPWYRRSFRLNFNQVFFVPVFAAAALSVVLATVNRLARGRTSTTALAIVLMIVFLAVVGIPGYRQSRSDLHAETAVDLQNYLNQARVDDDAEAAFRWLNTHARPGDAVVNEPRVNGSMWLYAEEGVPLVLGGAPVVADNISSRDYLDRRHLVQDVAEFGSDSRVDTLAERYRAKWVYYDSRTYYFAEHLINIKELQRNPRIVEVFQRGPVRVFALR